MLGFHFIAGILFILGKVQKYMRQLMSSRSNKVACRILARLHQWRGLEAEPKSKETKKKNSFLGYTLDHFILLQEEGRKLRIPYENIAPNKQKLSCAHFTEGFHCFLPSNMPMGKTVK